MKKFSSHLIFFNCLFYLFGFCVLSSWASQSYISYDDVYALKIEWPIFGNISIEGVSSNQIKIETVSMIHALLAPMAPVLGYKAL